MPNVVCFCLSIIARVKRSTRNRMKLKTFARSSESLDMRLFFPRLFSCIGCFFFSSSVCHSFLSLAAVDGWTKIQKLLIWNEGDFSTGTFCLFLHSKFHSNEEKKKSSQALWYTFCLLHIEFWLTWSEQKKIVKFFGVVVVQRHC